VLREAASAMAVEVLTQIDVNFTLSQ